MSIISTKVEGFGCLRKAVFCIFEVSGFILAKFFLTER